MSLSTILKSIRKSKHFLISTHVNPDPDALSSELAVAIFLRSLGKKVYIVNEDTVPDRFKFFPQINLVKKYNARIKYKFDAAIIVDCGDMERVGTVRSLISDSHIVINIDHHVTNDNFGDINWVKPQASSTAEVLFDALNSFKFFITKDVATLLYMGIMTDTGSFRYEMTSAHTHAVVSKLLKYKIPITELYRNLYESVPLADIKLFAKVVADFHIFFNGKVAVVELSKKVFQQFSQDFDLRDKIFKYLRTIKGLELIVILTEHGPGITRVNLRSQGQVDVAKLASRFNGGGHNRASGCVIEEDLSRAKQKILAALKDCFL